MKNNTTSSHQQTGAALLVALLILVIVSLLGITAMKSSMFASKIAAGTQADAMTFEAAETAVATAYNELQTMDGVALSTALSDGLVERCVTSGETTKAGTCTSSDFLDSRGLLQASSSTAQVGQEPISGMQVSTAGGTMIYVDYKVTVLGQSEMADFGLDNNHMQDLLKRGVKPASEL